MIRVDNFVTFDAEMQKKVINDVILANDSTIFLLNHIYEGQVQSSRIVKHECCMEIGKEINEKISEIIEKSVSVKLFFSQTDFSNVECDANIIAHGIKQEFEICELINKFKDLKK